MLRQEATSSGSSEIQGYRHQDSHSETAHWNKISLVKVSAMKSIHIGYSIRGKSWKILNYVRIWGCRIGAIIEKRYIVTMETFEHVGCKNSIGKKYILNLNGFRKFQDFY